MNPYLIGLDIGTSSVKGMLLSRDGRFRFTGKREFTYLRRPDGSVEIGAEDYLSACFDLLRDLAAALPAGGRIAGVSAASASGNLLLLEQGRPCTPIFNWQDTRVGDEADRVLGFLDREAYYRATGWAFDGHTFPLALLCWLKCREPERLERCDKVVMSTEYLFWRMTGRWQISTSTGTPFYLIDQRTGEYIPEVLTALGIPQEKLPPVGQAGALVGTVTPQAAALTGLPEGTPVFSGTFDHPSAARGAGVLSEGQMLLSCGTSWVGFFPLKDREQGIRNRMLVDPFLSAKGGCWAGMVSLPSVSVQVEEYLRKYVTPAEHPFREFGALAAQSSLGAGGLTLTLTPEDDERDIRSFPRHHIARALMEATVRRLKEQLDRLREGGICPSEAVMVGGPSENPVWAQVIREMTGLSVRPMHGSYAGALGSAMVAGIAAGQYADERSALQIIKESETT